MAPQGGISNLNNKPVVCPSGKWPMNNMSAVQKATLEATVALLLLTSPVAAVWISGVLFVS